MIKSCWKYGEGARFRFIVNYIFSVLGFSIRLLQPFIFGLAINKIQLNEPNLINSLMWLFIFYFISEVGFRIFHGTSDYLRTWLGFMISKNYKEKAYDKITRLSLKWHSSNHSGKIIKQIETASQGLFQFNFSQHQYVITLVNLFVPIFALFMISKKIGVLTLLGSIIITFNTIFFDKYIRKYYEIMIKKDFKISSALFDYISNITTVITLRIEELTKIELRKRIMDVFPSTKKRILLSLAKWSIYDLFNGFMTASLLFLFCYDSYNMDGIILVGSLSMIYSYLEKMKKTFFNINSLYSQLIRNQTEIDIAQEIFDEKEVLSTDFNKKVRWSKIDFTIDKFRYEEDEKSFSLNQVTMTIPRRSKIALIGSSGSGKSTLLKLLRGLYTSDDIFVSIDGKKENFLILKNITTLIPQDSEIFENTIENNITFGLRTTKNRIIKAIKLARFEDVIKRLPKGLDSNINEKGVNLSGGEKQRLALSRGLFAVDGTDIILLDEPTSNVDPENEFKIYENIFSEFSDKTIISALHRLHLLKNFDYIYLFNKGTIEAEGTFEQLLKNKRFKRMWDKYNLK